LCFLLQTFKERQIQAATWACSEYDDPKPEVAHGALLDYRRGDNEEGGYVEDFY